MSILRLQLPTDPRWVELVESNIEEILTDHAWCEQKAATNAITIITINSDYEDLVTDMLKIAQEEIAHFEMVHDIIKKRGYKLGRERKDDYVGELAKYMKANANGSRENGFVERMMFSAMIEARSCERFKVLSENIKDEDLSKFYRDLMESEAGHYTTFITYARKYGGDIDVEKRWKEWLAHEATIIARYGKKKRFTDKTDMAMNVFILDDYQQAVTRLDCFKLLEGFDITVLTETEKDPEKLSQKIQEAQVLVLIRERTEINEALLSRLPNLKLISQTGKISNHLDLDACTKYEVAVAEGIGSPIAPAELTWILIMNVLRQIPQAIEAMKKGEWQTNIGTTVHEKKIGIWGYGKIGKRIAGYAKAFGAEVVVWGSESSRLNAISDGFTAAQTKQKFFSGCDVVSLHLRLNNETFGIVKSSDLELMKPTAALINTARAELIEPGALLNALKNGRPGFAGIDVYENEPLYDIENPLLKMSNVLCTPHLGYVEQNGYELYFSKAFENVVAFADGNPVNIANPEVI